MNILLLGGAGFIGTHLTHALLEAGHVVRIFDRPSALVPPLIAGHPRLARIEGDVLNHDDVESALEDMEVVFHLVSTTLPKSSNDNPEYDIETNLVTSVRLLEAARRLSIRRVIFLSSGGTVYGVPEHVPIAESHPCNPISSYGIVKLAIEKYLHLYRVLHGLDSCTVRLSNPFGEYQRIQSAQGAVGVFLHRAITQQSIEIWGDGSVTRDYIYIGDVAEALLKLLDYDGPHKTFNIGSGLGMNLNEIIGQIEAVLGRSVSRVFKPARRFDVPVNVLDIGLARRELRWAPRTSFSEGLARTAAWITESDVQAG
jgi:UDP-glucose 4-epimerase